VVFFFRTVQDNGDRRSDYNIVITVCFACTRSTRTERSGGRNRKRDNRSALRRRSAYGATAEYVARRTRGAFGDGRSTFLSALGGAIVARPSYSVVVFRRPSLPRVCVCVCVGCRASVARAITVVGGESRPFCDLSSARARSRGPCDVLNFYPFLFSSADFCGSLRRPGDLYLLRIPAGHVFSLDRLALA